MRYYDNKLTFPIETGEIILLDAPLVKEKGVKNIVITLGDQTEFVKSIKLEGNEVIQRNSFFMNWLSKELILTGNEDGLYLTNITTGKVIKYTNPISLTACGVTTNPIGNLVGVGDFAGNAVIFTVDSETLQSELFMQCNIEESVRSVCFLDNEVLMIGSTSGAVFALGLPMFPTEPVKVFEVEGGVTTMRAYGGQTIMLCTTSGYIYVYERREDPVFDLVFKNMLHAPSERSDKFGSLRKLTIT